MRFRVRLIAVLLLFLACSSSIFGQTISGSIRDSGDNPLSGAVRLYDTSGQWIENFWLDEFGNFQTWPLANGSYFAVSHFTDGMLDEAWDNIPCENLICNVPGSTPIVITGGDVTGIDFVLDPIVSGGRISGVVKDPSDIPLADVGLVIRNSNGEHLYDWNTDLAGNYITALLADDNYYVHTSNEPFGLGRELYDNYPCVPADACYDPSVVTANGTAVVVSSADETGIDFSLAIPAGAIISGQLTDADTGIPLPDVHMNLLNEAGDYLANTNTDRWGNYYFSGLADGNYKIYAVGVPEGYTGELYGGDQCHEWSCDLGTSGTVIVISSGADAPDKDIVLDYSGTRLLGTITRSDTGEPVASQYGFVSADLFSAAGEYMGGWATNKAGQFQIHLAGAGSYYLIAVNDWDIHGLINEAWDDIKCQHDCDPLALGATLIPVAEGTTVVADFVLDPGFDLSGTIRIEGALTDMGHVNVWDAAGQYVLSGWNNGNGNWISDQLMAGTYYATVRGEDFGMVSQLYNGISCPQEYCDVTAGTPIVVSDSDVPGINFDLVPTSPDWTISGSVRDAADNPIGGGVRLFDPFGHYLADTGIDPEGHFEFESLANGTYFVVTLHTFEVLDEAWDDLPCENLICNIPDSTPISVDGADVSGIDFVLDPIVSGGRITGTVRDGSNMPVGGIGIEVFNANGEHLLGLDAFPDGSYLTEFLADDSYYVRTTNEPFGLGRELYDNFSCLPANSCDDPAVITANGTAVTISNAVQTGIDFSLEVPAGAIISGQLTDADTGIVLPDVHMNLLDEFNQYIAHTNTDAQGNYYFSGLADGTYKVYAVGVPEGYTGELYGGDHCHEWNCDLNTLGTPIAISGGVDAPNRDIVLDYSGTRLLGTITRGDTGEAVSAQFAHMGVDLFNTSGEYMGTWGTNRAGQFQIHLGGPGNFYLVATNDWDYHSLVNEAWDDIKCFNCDPVALGATLIPVADGVTVVADFEFDPGFTVSGTIKAEGVLTGEGSVTFWDIGGQLFEFGWNDGSGHWQSFPLPGGTYYATVRGEHFGMVSQLYDAMACPQEFCDVTAGTPIVLADADVGGIDFDLVPVSAEWTISGSVRDTGGNPLKGSVRILDPFGARLFDEPVDESGNFLTPPMADGTYHAITVGTREVLDEAWENIPCVNRLCDVTTTTPIVISAGDVAGIDFVLDPITVGGRISGKIEDSTNTPLPDVGIIIRNAQGRWLMRVDSGLDGIYQSPLLANETYYLQTRGEPFGFGREVYDDILCHPLSLCDLAFIIAHGTPVVIEGSNETGIDFSLDIPPGGLISGRITDADTGIPLPDVLMALMTTFGGELASAWTDRDGDYYFSGLADSDYKVIAKEVPEGYMRELYGGDHCPDGGCDIGLLGTPITISGGNMVDGKDIVLDYSGTRLLGTITRSDTGEPVTSRFAPAGVDLYDAVGGYLGTWPTNRAGQFQITLPGAGDYYLVATAEWNYHQLHSEAWDDIRCYGECDPLALGATLIPVADSTTFVADFELVPEMVFKHGFEE